MAIDFAGHLLTGGRGRSGIIWIYRMIERGVEYPKEWTHGRPCRTIFRMVRCGSQKHSGGADREVLPSTTPIPLPVSTCSGLSSIEGALFDWLLRMVDGTAEFEWTCMFADQQ